MTASNKKYVKLHTVVDLETLGTNNNAPILSIGAATAGESTDGSFVFLRTFHRVINIEFLDLDKYDLDLPTLKWWITGVHIPADARNVLDEYPGQDLPTVLTQFREYILDIGEEFIPNADNVTDHMLYGNSASFDLGILANSYEKEGVFKPWNYKQESCFRTIKSLYPEVTYSPSKSFTPHHAQEDAMYELEHLIAILAYIKLAKI